MVRETSQELIKALYNGNHINEMTEKWLSLTPNPPRIPVFVPLRYKDSQTKPGRKANHIWL